LMLSLSLATVTEMASHSGLDFSVAWTDRSKQ
jgi:hypothetical protein